MVIILLLNFAYLKKKEGPTKALSSDESDVIAILEASGVLRKRRRNTLKLFRKEDNRIDFIFRVYHPIYLVRHEGYIIPVDGLGMTQTYLNEDHISDTGFTSTMNALPTFGCDMCPWVKSWNENCSPVEEVRNGFVLPPLISKEEAQKIAFSVKKVLDSNKTLIDKLEKQLSSLNEQHEKYKLKLIEEYKSLLEDFDKKISLKNLEIESIETHREKSLINELVANFAKKRDELNQQRSSLEVKIAEVGSKIEELEKAREKLISKKESVKNKIDHLQNNIKKIREDREALEGRYDSPRTVEEKIKAEEKYRREVWNQNKELQACIEEINDISGKISGLKDEVVKIGEEIRIINEKEILLKSKEENEINSLHSRFSGERESLVKELLKLTEEKEWNLMELKSRELSEKIRYEKNKEQLELFLSKAMKDCQHIESIMLTDEELMDEVEVLQAPFYLFSSEGSFAIIEPQFFFDDKGRIEKAEGTCIVKNGLKYIEGNWEILSLLMFKARDTFDLLSSVNRSRIMAAAENLNALKVINDFQLSYLREVGST